MSEKRQTGKPFGEQFKDWRPASDAPPSEPPKPAPGAKEGTSDDPRRLRCGCLEHCGTHSAEEMDSMGFPWAPPNAQKPAPEIGSWITCDHDPLPHRMDPGWEHLCVNPVPVARALAEPESPSEWALYLSGWNAAIDVLARNINASNFERRRK